MYHLSYFLSNQESIIPIIESAMVFSSGMFWFQDEKPQTVGTSITNLMSSGGEEEG